VKLDWLEPEMQKAIEALTEPQRVAVVLYGEARSESLLGLVAVGCVIRNRVKADLHGDSKPDWWGEGYSDVVTRPWQFSCLSPKGGVPNYRKVVKFARRLTDKTPITDAKEKQCIWIAHGVIGDYVIDITKGADHYHTAMLMPRPRWARGKDPVVQQGAHVFYRLEAA